MDKHECLPWIRPYLPLLYYRLRNPSTAMSGSEDIQLELVRDFVNTRDVEEQRGELDSAEALRTWLVEHGLLAPRARADADALERARSLREALRALLLA